MAGFAAVVAAERHGGFEPGNAKAIRYGGIGRHEPVLEGASLIHSAALEEVEQLHTFARREIRQGGNAASRANAEGREEKTRRTRQHCKVFALRLPDDFSDSARCCRSYPSCR